jgi:hypothetical protein
VAVEWLLNECQESIKPPKREKSKRLEKLLDVMYKGMILFALLHLSISSKFKI